MKPITRKEKIIAGEELTPITREEMFLQKYGGGASGGADWNASEGETGYVKNRTHYEETTTVNEPLNITWDGNTEGLATVTIVGNTYYHISDIVLSNDYIKKATVTDTMGGVIELGNKWNDPEYPPTVTEDVVAFHGLLCFARKDNADYSDEFNTATFPKAGIYFLSIPGFVHVSSLTTTEPVEQTKTVVHKLDKKFLPNVETNDIVFTGVKNDEGRYDYTCNVDYAKARKALIGGATARMIWVDGNQITHPTLRSVKYSNQSVSLEFFDITNTDNTDGVIRYDEDGSIGGGAE